jgi:hypothetical protein
MNSVNRPWVALRAVNFSLLAHVYESLLFSPSTAPNKVVKIRCVVSHDLGNISKRMSAHTCLRPITEPRGKAI